MKSIHLVTDDGLYNRKAFYKVKIVFIHPLRMIVNLSIINDIKVSCISSKVFMPTAETL